MELTLTNKDKKLLSILACVLIVVGLGWYLIRPLYERSSELDLQIEEAQLTQQEMQLKMQMYPVSQRNYEELKAQAAEATKDYYDLLTTQEVDKEITNIIIGQNLECVNLNISRMAPTESVPYPRSVKANAEEIGAMFPDYAAETEAAADTSDLSPEEQAEAYASSSTAPTAVQDAGVQDQIYSYQVHVTVEGREAAYQKLLDLLSNDYPAIRVTGVSYQQGAAKMIVRPDGSTTEGQSVEQMNLDLELYMCNKALYAQSNSSTAEGSSAAEALADMLLGTLMGAGS